MVWVLVSCCVVVRMFMLGLYEGCDCDVFGL